MTDQPPTRRRRVRVFVVTGGACFVAAICAAKGHDLFNYGWPEWLCTGLTCAEVLDRLFPNAEV